MGKEIKIWYDKKGDNLEVIFERKEGYFRETENEAVMEKVDNEGKTIGFSILNVSVLKDKPLSLSLKEHQHPPQQREPNQLYLPSKAAVSFCT